MEESETPIRTGWGGASAGGGGVFGGGGGCGVAGFGVGSARAICFGTGLG
ncbi:hypothetical protein AKJ08_2719 [Vulgatibacter incomptus]|uniref:Uncharacterized protein n=1 Tax=Vulgatibacter incomptus TaxID=1391653 RepID=A0A0K1PFP9_9BACT|nr:hypothetical protein AKJ08_2719 [Vulgatibacter incomptus]